jgi:glycosyltransferase involved in cell wall biosynthesis
MRRCSVTSERAKSAQTRTQRLTSPLRLVYLSNSKIPSREANSIHVMKMCQALAELGHSVTLLAPDVETGIEPGVTDIYAFYGVAPSFQVRKLSWRRFKGRGWVYGWEAGRFAKGLDVDAAFGRSLHACAVAARSGLPTVWDAHMLTFLQRPAERQLFRLMIGAPAFLGMTTNCEALRRAILAKFPALWDRIVAAQNGADILADDLELADLGKTGDRPQIGYVGQLYPGKGFEIVRALAALMQGADFHVVGGEQAKVDRLRADRSLPQNIRLHGFKPPAEADRLTLAFDAVLAPYQTEVQIAGGGETAAWMSPLKVFGYMAAGKPILCSDLPVLREVIEDGRNGLLLPPDDAQAWADALTALLKNRELRERLGATALADFLARHTWKKRAARVIALLLRDGGTAAIGND